MVPAVDSTGALRDVSLEVWAAHSELPYFEKVLTFLISWKQVFCQGVSACFLGAIIWIFSQMQWFTEPPNPMGKENGQTWNCLWVKDKFRSIRHLRKGSRDLIVQADAAAKYLHYFELLFGTFILTLHDCWMTAGLQAEANYHDCRWRWPAGFEHRSCFFQPEFLEYIFLLSHRLSSPSCNWNMQFFQRHSHVCKIELS